GLEVVSFVKFEKEQTQKRTYEVYDAPSLIWDEMLMRLERGENLFVVTDYQKWLRRTERFLAEQGIEGTFIDGENSGEDWARQIIANPNQWIEEARPRVFGCSPALVSGVSFDDPQGHFHAMAFNLTHLEPRDAKQICDRLRTDVPRFGCIKEKSVQRDTLYGGCRPDLIIRDLRQNTEGVKRLIEFAQYAVQQTGEADLVTALQRMEQDLSNPDSILNFYMKYYARYKARENYNKLAIRDTLMALWESRGYKVHFKPLGSIRHLAEESMSIGNQLDQETTEQWVKTDTGELTVSEAHTILNLPGASPQNRLKARKRLMEDRLPGAPLNQVDFVLKTIVQNQGQFLRSTELLWLSQHPEEARQLDRWSWGNSFSQSAKTGRFVVVHQLSNRSALARLLSLCPLQSFMNGEIEQWDNRTPHVLEVHQWAKLHRDQLRRYARLTVSENDDLHPVKTVNKILRKLYGRDGIEEVGWKGSRENRQRQYQLVNREDQDRETILKALSDRFESRQRSRDRNSSNNSLPAKCDHQCTPLEDVVVKALNAIVDEIGRITPEEVEEILATWIAPASLAVVWRRILPGTRDAILSLLPQGQFSPLINRFLKESVALQPVV
ncbi:MAG: hypothetical protein SFW36_03620, partial [Leptolyngbyaceae cyanobacterium bins.59]|nr:hypothetical protein [Leptolyngbyaceae cyanobacterium bins.59]